MCHLFVTDDGDEDDEDDEDDDDDNDTPLFVTRLMLMIMISADIGGVASQSW